jgi:Zn-dependent protease with chaperone function
VARGALNLLDEAQLDAVLAHERGHLHGRHDALSLLVRGLAAALPGVPLFDAGERAVARLAEMSADDNAVRSSGRGPLVAALVAIATGQPASGDAVVPRAALAAATYAVQARVERILRRPSRSCLAGYGVALAAVVGLLAALPAAILALAG